MTIADILEKAADLCERGWTQVSFAANKNGFEVPQDEDGHYPGATCFCIAGAINQTAALNGLPIAERRDAKHFLTDFLEHPYVEWNEERGRTQPEVVAKLREAAARAREAGL